MATISPYERLGLAQTASSKDIKVRYRNLVREFPPEQNPDKFMEYRAAYDELMSTEMDAREFFPVYLKPLDFFNQKIEEKTNDFNKKALLGTIFETPFQTFGELKTLLKK